MPRLHNFSAGPALLPLSVIEQLIDALPEFDGTGQGLMELSHRSQSFDNVIVRAEEHLRTLLGIPKSYTVLFLQGGASLQFFMCPLNLLCPGDGADYLMTGTWSSKALVEAKRCGDARPVWEIQGPLDRVPQDNEYTIRDNSVFVHYTSNNTIYGTQYSAAPNTNGLALVSDMSSDICSRPIDVAQHDVIYAGAQKNLGPSGVTLVILSPRALERSALSDRTRDGGLPSMLNYGLMASKRSLFNTPNTFGIYALERMLSWLKDQGGVGAIEQKNTAKANTLYTELDRSAFWTPYAQPNSRSIMNVTWTTPSPDLDALFVKEASDAGLVALRGHRSVGGLRASIYNACSLDSINALVSFMQNFESNHG